MATSVPDLTTRLSDEVRDAVIAEYSRMTDTPLAAVSAGFFGGLEFDSIIGLELSVGLEECLAIVIPEKRLLKSDLYRSLHNYASEIQACVDSSRQKSEDTQ